MKETMKILKTLNKYSLCVLLCAFLAGCSTIKYVPVENRVNEITVLRDSTVIRDSVVIIPRERIVDIVPQYDTLHLENSVAISTSFVDTCTHTLKGKLESKVDKIVNIKYLDRVIYRDSLRVEYVDKPYPVEVEKKITPKWAWYSLIINIILLFLGLAVIYLKYH